MNSFHNSSGYCVYSMHWLQMLIELTTYFEVFFSLLKWYIFREKDQHKFGKQKLHMF